MRFIASSALLLSTLAAVGHASPAEACTTYSTHGAEGTLVAKNFDWPTGEGWIVVNERGRVHTKLVPGGAPDIASWGSRFASVSFSTVGPGYPISGMNEAGLTIEALVDQSVTPSTTPDPDRLIGLELVQYGLDRFASAAELAAFAEQRGVSQLAIPLHFFACDRTGECAVIESRAGHVVATRGADLRVHALANRPYGVDANPPPPPPKLASLLGLAREAPRSSSGDRFATVSRGIAAGRPRDVNDAFGLLDAARIPGLTKWQIVWDVEHATVHFRDRPGAAIVSLHADLGARCDGAPRVRAIGRAGASPAFAAWSADDVAHAERAVLAQLQTESPRAAHLATAVAASTRATRCQAVE
jgi:choloylglycine hydrolase